MKEREWQEVISIDRRLCGNGADNEKERTEVNDERERMEQRKDRLVL